MCQYFNEYIIHGERYNSVRVVLLIARGWRGTSLPRVSIRKGIQRRRC